MTPEEIESRTAARMKWLKENLIPEEWAQVERGVQSAPDNATLRLIHLKQSGAMASFAEKLEREGEPRAAAMADQLAEFYRLWAQDPGVVPPEAEAPPSVLPSQPRRHWSDCATHNEPAYPAGPCNCGALAAVKNCRCEELGADQREHIGDQCIPRYIVGS